jgi:hypothetical protein
MRDAVTVAGPMPSPRKKMTFLASPAACAAGIVRQALAAAAASIPIRVVIFMSIFRCAVMAGWLRVRLPS